VVMSRLYLRSTKDGCIEKMEEVLKSDSRIIVNNAGDEEGSVNVSCTRGKGCTLLWRVDRKAKTVCFDEECI